MTGYYETDNYRRIRQTVGSTEPLTLSEAKENLRIESDFTDEDDLITAMISAARDHVETYLNRYIVPCDVLVVVDELPGTDQSLYLPLPDMTSITDAFSYVDEYGESQTYAGTLTLDPDYQTIKPSTYWPTAQAAKFVVGVEGPVETSAIKQAMQLLIADMYELRTAQIVGTIRADNPAVKALLAPYRVEMGV